MSRRPFYRVIGVALAIALLVAPVAWSAPSRDTSAATWALDWMAEFGAWLWEVTTTIGSSQDCGPGIDPNGVAGSSPADANGTCHDCSPGINPNG